jgi:hypothetical protein
MACEYHYVRSQKRPGYYSQKIDSVVSYLREVLGYEVIMHDERLLRTSEEAIWGHVDYETKTVSLHCYCAGCALLTLLHEAGHILHRQAVGTVTHEKSSVREREVAADLHGRRLSDAIGLELEEEWQEFSSASNP